MSHRKKILYLTFDFIQPIFSGNGTLSRIQVLGLLERGFEVLVLCPDGDVQEDSELKKWLDEGTLQICCVHLRTSKDLSSLCDWEGFYSYFSNHMKGIRDFHPNLIINPDWHTFEVASLIKQTLSIPLVSQFFRIFSFFTEYIPISQQYEAVRKKELQMVSQSDLIITLSKFDRDWCLENGATNVHIVYPPLSDSFIHALSTEPRHNSKWNTDSQMPNLLHLLTISRIVPEKRLQRVPPLLAELQKMGVKFSYTLIGEPLDKGYQADLLKKLAEYDLLSHVVLLGRVTLKEMVHYLRECHIYLHPSSYEPYGITIMEAAAAGCTVVLDQNGLIGAKEVLRTFLDEVGLVEINYSTLHYSVKKILSILKRGKTRKKDTNNLGMITKLNSKHYMDTVVTIFNDFI